MAVNTFNKVKTMPEVYRPCQARTFHMKTIFLSGIVSIPHILALARLASRKIEKT